ncbi:hypothetical protein LUZ61_010070 [Rhynchospora tenuis]|uniref:KIB1-4 beta-propeller domain-containing protein n=1 Tax=Rhynchospora tenuis TaxID=198213 RepID=A0AAD5ZYJ6_9POAL|nr:hypothetical protein LUZ61_010070 [Rhynchospora tenuis]
MRHPQLHLFPRCLQEVAAATSLSDPPRQFPCVIDWPRGKGKLDDTLRVYSISSRKTHTFQVPDAHFLGPSDGYVLLYEPYRSAKECQSFLNPLTWKEWLFPLDVPLDIVGPIRLGRNLIQNDGPALLYEDDEHDFLCFWQPEKNDWTDMIVPSIRTVALYDHKFFFAERGHQYQRIGVIDEITGVLLSYLPPPTEYFYYKYLIATDDGLLAVELKGSTIILPSFMTDASDVTKCQFEVFRLENYPQNSHWIKLSEIGDLMLFLDKQNGFSLKASDFDGFKGNCIYFITSGIKYPKREYEHVIGRFDLESNRTEMVPAPAWLGLRQWERQAAWFIPTLN